MATYATLLDAPHWSIKNPSALIGQVPETTPRNILALLLCSGEMFTFAPFLAHISLMDLEYCVHRISTTLPTLNQRVTVEPLQGLAHQLQANRPVQGALSCQPIIRQALVRHQYRQPGRFPDSSGPSSRSTLRIP